MTGDWRPIPSTLNLYEASSEGQIRRADTGHILKSMLRLRDGYYQVDLCIEGRRHTRVVHALVCEAFHGPRPPSGNPRAFHAAHLNGRKAENTPGNLAWVTARENMMHKFRHGTQPVGVQISHSVLTEADVREIRRRAGEGAKNRALAERYRVASQTIDKIVRRQRWAHVA
jgi:hypothetical protein